jgi:hypothetical protein
VQPQLSKVRASVGSAYGRTPQVSSAVRRKNSFTAQRSLETTRYSRIVRITDIVVSEEKGLPMYMAEGEELKSLSSQAHVFVYDWLKRPPKPEYFAKDWEED